MEQRREVLSLLYYNPPFSCLFDTIYRIYGMGEVIL